MSFEYNIALKKVIDGKQLYVILFVFFYINQFFVDYILLKVVFKEYVLHFQTVLARLKVKVKL